MDKLVNSDDDIAATAGSIFVENDKKNFVTKLQQWDYTLGIFGVKLYQGNYNSTLVAQGAFSAYKTKTVNDVEDTVAIKKAIAIAENKKFNEEKMKEKIELDDKDLKVIEKVPFNSNDLIVITVAKK